MDVWFFPSPLLVGCLILLQILLQIWRLMWSWRFRGTDLPSLTTKEHRRHRQGKGLHKIYNFNSYPLKVVKNCDEKLKVTFTLLLHITHVLYNALHVATFVCDNRWYKIDVLYIMYLLFYVCKIIKTNQLIYTLYNVHVISEYVVKHKSAKLSCCML